MQLLSIYALAEWKGMHWTPPVECECCLMSAPPILRASRSYYKTSSVYTTSFVLLYQIFHCKYWSDHHPTLACLGWVWDWTVTKMLSVPGGFSARCQSGLQAPHDERGSWGVRCDFSSHTFASQSHWFSQSKCVIQREFHSSLGWDVLSCTVCQFTLRQRRRQMPEFHSRRIQVKALLMQLWLIQHYTY